MTSPLPTSSLVMIRCGLSEPVALKSGINRRFPGMIISRSIQFVASRGPTRLANGMRVNGAAVG